MKRYSLKGILMDFFVCLCVYQCCPCLWTVHSLIATSTFSNVHIIHVLKQCYIRLCYNSSRIDESGITISPRNICINAKKLKRSSDLKRSILLLVLLPDTKGVIRSGISKKDRQCNYQQKKAKTTNNDLRNTTQKTKDTAT